MTDEQINYANEIARIGAEEATVGYGVGRYWLLAFSIGLFFSFYYYAFISEENFDVIILGGNKINLWASTLLFFSIVCSFGYWRMNIIYHKLKKVTDNKND